MSLVSSTRLSIFFIFYYVCIVCECRRVTEREGEIQGCQYGVGCDVRRVDRLLNDTNVPRCSTFKSHAYSSLATAQGLFTFSVDHFYVQISVHRQCSHHRRCSNSRQCVDSFSDTRVTFCSSWLVIFSAAKPRAELRCSFLLI